MKNHIHQRFTFLHHLLAFLSPVLAQVHLVASFLSLVVPVDQMELGWHAQAQVQKITVYAAKCKRTVLAEITSHIKPNDSSCKQLLLAVASCNPVLKTVKRAEKHEPR
jgi:hypothetical protein